MSVTRREFLQATAAFLAGTSLIGTTDLGAAPLSDGSLQEWDQVRGAFELDPDCVHMACLLLASHPRPVRTAIDRFRRALDANPTLQVDENRWNLEFRARRVAAAYLGADRDDVALIRSTTEGIGLVYHGLRVRAGQELLTTTHDYPLTQRALAHKGARCGARLVRVPLEFDPHSVTAAALVDRVLGGVTARTRILALTWVHSKTGLKFPVRRLGDAVAEINRGRDPANRLVTVVDGVHGLGVEELSVLDLGCDFFFAGTHKWLFGPRGTGILWGHPRAQGQLDEIVPTFTADGSFGGRLTPGGFKAFEHDWAQPEAFAFHEAIGRRRVTARVRELNRLLKAGLAEIPRVRLHTPAAGGLSSGITCFDVEGMTPEVLIARLKDLGIVGSVTPYRQRLARLTPGVINTPDEVARVASAVARLAR